MALSAGQRREVYDRAGGCCEYCRRSATVRLAEFEIDHIVSLKYGGKDVDENLCLACMPCNRQKGLEVAALDPRAQALLNLALGGSRRNYRYNPARAWEN